MKTNLKIVFATVSALSLAACGEEWGTEAGSWVDEGGFGNPTMNNTMVQTGQMVIDLNARFAEQVPTMVNFAFDSAVLDDEARAVLRRQADWIKQFPEVRFRVYGHTDLVGSAAYNEALGRRRAEAVVSYLVSQGISRSRLEALVSKGLTQPLIVTPEPERRNRRTVTEVSGFVQRHPTVMDGKYARIIYREYVASATEAPPSNETTISQISDAGGG
ncbi:OmpA family protein [Palleronia sp. KMU-117]|uniref:OmpA family protein n=1 Tax=Palleronia sp. KMU-117 TaxID=3434108 RepID=UPI003D73E500